MKNYYGRRVRIYAYGGLSDNVQNLFDTGKPGRLLEIDVHNGHVMVEDTEGGLVKLFYKLVRLV